MNLEIKVPDIGDFKNVEIIEVLIKEGDQIKKNDPTMLKKKKFCCKMSLFEKKKCSTTRVKLPRQFG